jgi:hypothetical protein
VRVRKFTFGPIAGLVVGRYAEFIPKFFLRFSVDLKNDCCFGVVETVV